MEYKKGSRSTNVEGKRLKMLNSQGGADPEKDPSESLERRSFWIVTKTNSFQLKMDSVLIWVGCRFVNRVLWFGKV